MKFLFKYQLLILNVSNIQNTANVNEKFYIMYVGVCVVPHNKAAGGATGATNSCSTTNVHEPLIRKEFD